MCCRPPRVKPRLSIRVSWLSGGSAAKLPVKVSAQMNPYLPSFSGWEAFNFSRNDLDRDGDDESSDGGSPRRAPAGIHRDRLVLDKQAVELDAQGTARVRIGGLPAISAPHKLAVEATFEDPSGEIQSVSRSTLIYPSQLVVGVKTDGWAAMGDTIGMRVAVLDTSGRAQKGREVKVVARLERTISHRKRLVGGFYAYENQRQSKELGEVCKTTTQAGGIAFCEIAPDWRPAKPVTWCWWRKPPTKAAM